MSSQPVPDAKRALITFAAVNDEVRRSNDFLRGIAPLFATISSDFKGQLFNADAFRRKLRSQFGLQVPEEIAATMAPRLAGVGLLERRNVGKDGPAYFWVDKTSEEIQDYSIFDSQIEQITSDFQSFASQLPQAVVKSYTREELQNFLFDFLLSETTELSEAFGVLYPEEASKQDLIRYKSEGEYLAARFVKHLQTEEDTGKIDQIAGIKNAILVSEVVVELGQTRQTHKKQVDVSIYIDAPLMMYHLGVSGEERKEFANQVISGLRALGARVLIFDHSVDEIRESLHAVLKNTVDRRGPTADALRRGQVEEAYVAHVMYHPEEAIEQTDVRIFKGSQVTLTPAQKAHFNEADRQRLYSLMVGIHRRDVARARDVLSAGIVISRRAGGRTSNPFRSQHLLITDNDRVSLATKRFMIEEKGAAPTDVPPAMTLSRIAAAVWLEVGLQEKLDISRKQLVAACARTLSIKPEIVDRIRSNLRRINPENAPQYEAILSQPRYLQMAMDYTLGAVEAVTNETAVQFFDRVKEDIAKEEREKAAKIRRAADKESKRRIGAKDNEISALKNALAKQQAEGRARFERAAIPLMKAANRKASAVLFIVMLLGITGLALTTFSYLGGDATFAMALLGFIISSVMFVIGILGLTHTVIRNIVINMERRRVGSKLSEAGYAEELSKATLDFDREIVAWDEARPEFELAS
jgi:hypothetical protein